MADGFDSRQGSRHAHCLASVVRFFKSSILLSFQNAHDLRGRLYDSFQTRTLQSTRVYAWPNPPLYTFASGSLPTSRPDRSHASTSSENLPKTKTHQILGGFEPRPSFIDQLPPDHPSLVKLLHIGAVPNQSDGQQDGPTSDIVPDFLQQSTSADVSKPFQGLKFYIASDAKVSSNISVAIAKRLETSGAASVFVAPDKVRSKAKKTFTEAEVSGAYLPEWEDKIKEADFVVCSERSGWEYWLASDLGKCVGTLFWLLTVIVTGKLDDPLHYVSHMYFSVCQCPVFADFLRLRTDLSLSASTKSC